MRFCPPRATLDPSRGPGFRGALISLPTMKSPPEAKPWGGLIVRANRGGRKFGWQSRANRIGEFGKLPSLPIPPKVKFVWKYAFSREALFRKVGLT